MSIVGRITIQCKDPRHGEHPQPFHYGESYGYLDTLFTVPAAEFMEFSMGRAFDDQHNLLSNADVHKAMSKEGAMCHHCFALRLNTYAERMERMKSTGHDLADLNLRQLWLNDHNGVSFWFDWWRHVSPSMLRDTTRSQDAALEIDNAMIDLRREEEVAAHRKEVSE